jgi:hypothetical protein
MGESYKEAEEAKHTRMVLNRQNYDMYHLRHDFSHKREGQSKEVLAKVAMAVEQIKSFFQQALVDIGDWWDVEFQNGKEQPEALLQPHEVFKLTNYMLDKADYFSHVGSAIQSALLGSLAITKVSGKEVSKPVYRTKKEGKGKDYKKKLVKEEDKTFRLQFDVVRQESWFPDPLNFKVFEIEECFLDYHKVLALSKGDEAIYDHAAVKDLSPFGSEGTTDKERLARETGQDIGGRGHRPQVKIWEFWGDVVDKETGDILHENVVYTVANEKTIIRKPTPNPNWNQESPFVVTPLLEVANSVWHKSLMDAPTQHNRALIEIYNLLVDSALKSVHGISQIRVDMLEDPDQVSDGIEFGDTLKVNSSLPIGAKVMEPVITGDVPGDALNVMNLMSQEFNAAALTNDLRSGVLPDRAVKATEVVSSDNSITSIFQGISKNIESVLIHGQLEKAWHTVAQNFHKISKEELQSLFGADRGEEMSQMDAEDVFESTVNGLRFKVFGISLTIGKQQDLQKYLTMLQTIGSSEVMIEEFAKKYDFGKLLGEVLRTLDIDKNKIEIDKEQGALQQQNAMQQPGAAPGAQPDQMSQVGGVGPEGPEAEVQQLAQSGLPGGQ